MCQLACAAVNNPFEHLLLIVPRPMLAHRSLGKLIGEFGNSRKRCTLTLQFTLHCTQQPCEILRRRGGSAPECGVQFTGGDERMGTSLLRRLRMAALGFEGRRGNTRQE
ncbi:hypothetical protein CUB86_18800 [Pseudomonas syringae pv. actinidiae]|nr:hypothetical protein CT122_26355 [Pseudomonas syringae pv. actinidiae]PIN60042.1 hypothetical protein CUB86_18800 [Pseudomonas syringae pv. actinidiae]